MGQCLSLFLSVVQLMFALYIAPLLGVDIFRIFISCCNIDPFIILQGHLFSLFIDFDLKYI
jgi:hypothetical protein